MFNDSDDTAIEAIKNVRMLFAILPFKNIIKSYISKYFIFINHIQIQMISNTKFLLTFKLNLLLFLLIVPKINLININNSWQGIKEKFIEVNLNLKEVQKTLKSMDFDNRLERTISMLTYLVGAINNFPVHIASLFRIFEQKS